MRIFQTALLMTMFYTPSVAFAAQTPANEAPAQNVAPGPVVPSALLQPSLDLLLPTVSALKLDKWKGGTVRAEATANITSVQKDLQATLPALLKDADAAPGTLSKLLPVTRNVDALYEVLLRVVDGARIAAPGDQVTQLQQAMVNLESARLKLADRLLELAATQEKQLSDFRSKLQAQSALMSPTAPAPVPTCVAPPPARKTVKKKPKPPAIIPPPANSPAAPKPGN